MPLPNRETRKQIRDKLAPEHPQLDDIFSALDTAETLLERSLYEFGSELRSEIEQFLGEPPLLRS